MDTYYAERRARTTLIGLACEQMGPSCFCTSLGSAPDDGAGMDVMLYRAEGGYVVETLTDKGAGCQAGQTLAALRDHDPGRDLAGSRLPGAAAGSLDGALQRSLLGRPGRSLPELQDLLLRLSDLPLLRRA